MTDGPCRSTDLCCLVRQGQNPHELKKHKSKSDLMSSEVHGRSVVVSPAGQSSHQRLSQPGTLSVVLLALDGRQGSRTGVV